MMLNVGKIAKNEEALLSEMEQKKQNKWSQWNE